MLRLLACFTDSDTWRRLPSMTTAALSITQIENTHLVRCGHANWVLVEEGADLTLIDGGYPANGADVERSIEQIGHQLGDVRAILVTHAHVDHIGGIADIVTRLEVPVLMDPLEVPHAKREYLQQLSPAGVPLLLWRRGAPKWLRDVIGVGALKGAELPQAQAFASGGALDVPGRIVPIPTHGHTDGHSAYLVPDAGVIASGDALVTGHATSSVAGPQFLVCPFNHDREATDEALDNIAAAPAGALFPGHGPVYEGSMAAAVEQARAGRTRMRP
jgi:glyoxylase-like metal-dependent hydrolase (beta-lactamase superfamily II)